MSEAALERVERASILPNPARAACRVSAAHAAVTPGCDEVDTPTGEGDAPLDKI